MPPTSVFNPTHALFLTQGIKPCIPVTEFTLTSFLRSIGKNTICSMLSFTLIEVNSSLNWNVLLSLELVISEKFRETELTVTRFVLYVLPCFLSGHFGARCNLESHM